MDSGRGLSLGQIIEKWLSDNGYNPYSPAYGFPSRYCYINLPGDKYIYLRGQMISIMSVHPTEGNGNPHKVSLDAVVELSNPQCFDILRKALDV